MRRFGTPLCDDGRPSRGRLGLLENALLASAIAEGPIQTLLCDGHAGRPRRPAAFSPNTRFCCANRSGGLLRLPDQSAPYRKGSPYQAGLDLLQRVLSARLAGPNRGRGCRTRGGEADRLGAAGQVKLGSDGMGMIRSSAVCGKIAATMRGDDPKTRMPLERAAEYQFR